MLLARQSFIDYATRMFRCRPRVPVILLALVWCACSSSGGDGETSSATLLTVSPSMFDQGVVCGDLPGAWTSYVATLTDVTNVEKPFTLASSNPVRCSMPVAFSWVVPGHRYVADIDGYEQNNLVSYGGSSSGSRHVIDPTTGREVEPRWQTSCGKSSESDEYSPTTVYLRTNVVVDDCVPMTELRPGSTETGVTVDLSSVRGNLSCGRGPGQVARYRVTPLDTSLDAVEPACDEVLSFTPVAANTTVRFFVEAFEADAPSASWATTCERHTVPGVVLAASCDLLSNRGSLRIDIDAVLAKAARSCSAQDIVSYRAAVVGTTLSAGVQPCASSAVFTNLNPASYQVVVDAFDASGQERLNAFCEGTVRVGQITDVSCQVLALE